MEDLTSLAGIPIYLDGETLVLGESLGERLVTRTRLVDTLREVWMDPSVSGERVVYTTLLEVFASKDKEIFGETGLQHGYVVIPAGRYGREYPKQIGHYHPAAPGTPLGFPELHMVLHGTGHFLLQESEPPYGGIQDAIVVEAKAGDKFCLPPNYGHLVVNPSDTTLVFEGFSARGFVPDYEPYKKQRGGVYYEVAAKGGKAAFIKNEHYHDPPELRRVSASEIPGPEELRNESSCYSAVVSHLGGFAFLRDPTLYREEWQF